MNAPDPIEEDLRALLKPVSPELKTRIAGDLNRPGNVSAQHARPCQLHPAGHACTHAGANRRPRLRLWQRSHRRRQFRRRARHGPGIHRTRIG